MSLPRPLRFDLDVPPDGRIYVQLPLPAPAHVTVYVAEHAGSEFANLVAAAASSTDFWDNPYDDDWNEGS